MKRLLSAALALLLCFSITVPALAWGPTFRDVPDTHWAYAAVEEAAAAGIINGYLDGTFRPDEKLTCAHFCAILSRAFYPEEYAAAEALPENQTPWWSAAVTVCYDKNLLNGTGLLPNYGEAEQPMTRYDMAQMLANVIAERAPAALPSEQAMATARTTIEDWNDIPNQYHQAVSVCYAARILQGIGGSFNGEGFMTRAQACTVYTRLNDLLLRYAPLPQPDVPQPDTPEA